MPTVPTAGVPRVGIDAGPNVQFDAPNVAVPDARLPTPTISTSLLRTPQLEAPQLKTPRYNPEALRAAPIDTTPIELRGQATAQFAGATANLMRMYQGYQVKVNATRVDDALNSALEAKRRLEWGQRNPDTGEMAGGYRNVRGADAVKPADGKALDKNVGDEFDRNVREIEKTLSNGAQRRAFSMQVNNIRGQLMQGVSQHMANEFEQYHTSVYKGQLENLTAEAASNYQDNPALKATLDHIDGVVATIANQRGTSAAEMEADMRSARTAAVSGAVEQARVDKKLGRATALLNDYAKTMNPETVRQLRARLDQDVSTQAGEDAATALWSGADARGISPAPPATSVDRARVHAITTAAESPGGKDFDERGRPVVSPKGAKYGMQVLPETAKKPGFGIKPAQNDGPEEYNRVGREYIDALTNKYGGDMRKAWAAYNWGHGNVDAALKEHGADWLAHAPKETREYVAKTVKAYGTDSAGTPQRMPLEAMYNEIDRQLPGADNMAARKAAYAWLDKRTAVAERDEREGHENALSEALRLVRKSGGDINAIPPTLRERVKPDQWDAVETYAKNEASGAYRVTDPAAYIVAMDPASLRAMNVNQFEALRPQLSEQDYQTARNAWLDLHSPTPSKSPYSLDLQSIDKIVDTRLEAMGIDIKPKKNDMEGIARLAGIREFVHNTFLEAQKQAGQKIVDYDAQAMVVDRLFTRSQPFKQLTIAGEKHGQLNVMTAREADLPADTRTRIRAKLQDQLKRKPTEAEVLGSYYRSQFYRTPASRPIQPPRIDWGATQGASGGDD